MSRTKSSLIRNRDYIKQVLSFEGLKRGNVYPSDIDAVIELHNKHLILFEVKREGTIIPIGQKLMLERLVDSWNSINKIASALYVTHNTKHTEDIMLSECDIMEIYYLGKWVKVDKLKVVDFLNKYYKKYNYE